MPELVSYTSFNATDATTLASPFGRTVPARPRLDMCCDGVGDADIADFRCRTGQDVRAWCTSGGNASPGGRGAGAGDGLVQPGHAHGGAHAGTATLASELEGIIASCI
eukprot:248183-Chlamydomonas_euryale.AAC.1